MTELVRLRYLAEVNPDTPEFDGAPIDALVTFVPLEAVWADGRLDVRRTRPLSGVRLGYVRFRSGDILCPKVTPTFQAGRSAIVGTNSWGFGAATTEVHVLRARPGNDHRLIRFTLLSKRFLEEGVSRFQGVAGLQRVPDDFVRNFRVAARGLEEQRRIADFLDDQVARLDAATTAAHKLLRLSEASAVSALANAYGTRPRPDSLEGRTREPVISIRALTRALLGGGTPSTTEPDFWDDEDGVPWIAIGDMVDGGYTTATAKGLSTAGLRASRLIPASAGTVLVAMYASVGKTTVTTTESVWNQAILGLVPKPGVDADFLLGWLELARPVLPVIARSATQDNLNADQVARLRVPRRSAEQQRSIGSERRRLVDWRRAVKRQVERQLALLDERKRALITACVTGEFEITAASDRAGDAALAGLPR